MPGENPWRRASENATYYSPKIQAPSETRTRAVALVAGLESRRANRYTTRRPYLMRHILPTYWDTFFLRNETFFLRNETHSSYIMRHIITWISVWVAWSCQARCVLSAHTSYLPPGVCWLLAAVICNQFWNSNHQACISECKTGTDSSIVAEFAVQ